MKSLESPSSGCFSDFTLTDISQFMWRFVGGRDARDEVEVVLNVSTTSYVALGKSVSEE